MDGRKRITVLLTICICLLFTGCSNAFARQEYDSEDKIAQTADHYAKVKSVFKWIQEGYSFEASKFDGRETLWSDLLSEDKDIGVEISFALSSGTAKVVHIDGAGNVETVIECTPETSTNGYVTKTVSLRSGQNRLKIVGFDCQDLDLEVLSPDF